MKHVIIIPSLNPKQKLISVVDEFIHMGEDKIIIVNDGSDVTCTNIFKKLSGYKEVTILNHKTNLGKGAALKTAFSYCTENFKDYYGVVTATDDGQYNALDVFKVAKELEDSRNRLVLGQREFNRNNILSNVLKFLYNFNIPDPRTALRGISMSELTWVARIKGEHYEYEVNMLIEAKRRNVEIRQVPVKTSTFNLSEVSHYRIVIDTVRIIILLMLNLFLYSAASIGAAIIDVGTFFICNTLIFSKFNSALRFFISTVIARILSSLWNFSMNRKFFTKEKGEFKKHVVKYYLLWFCQMMTSYSLLYLLSFIFNIYDSVLKSLIDICLGIISYQIQLKYVFSSKKSKEGFYGGLYYFCRWILRVFTRRLEIVGEIPNEATVFVGHHQNLKGAITIMTWFERPLHIWILDVFCEKKSCFEQYYKYTLTKRLGFSKPIAYICSHIFSSFVPKLAKSIEAIPVARNSVRVLDVTIKPSVDALEKDESILLFPDIDYSSKSDSMGKMYTGFLSIDKYYFTKYNKHVNFVPIKVNPAKGQINIGHASIINEGENLVQAKKRVASELVEQLNLL